MKKIVMAGLDPAIHLICQSDEKLDARIKSAHDDFFVLNFRV
ncbi:MAG: hypothetical protein K0Q70_2059 [Rhodospirillales bacterium]|jgi:hypothetical protein|nr:hypothetical protein [Rhodospirillales bacterium]